MIRTPLAMTVNARPAESGGERTLDRLALLYEPVLTAIGRVHTGRQRVLNPEEFRNRMKQALQEIVSSASRRGYFSQDIQEGNFAVVAFLDEAILTAPGSGETNWVGKSLGEELYDQRSAGELFFKRLETLRARPDSQELGEVLEIYYLCLLMGYEGRFTGGAKGELLQLMMNLRERISLIFGRHTELSPDASPTEVPLENAPPPDHVSSQLRMFAVSALLFAVVCIVAFSIQLQTQNSHLREIVNQKTGSVIQP